MVPERWIADRGELIGPIADLLVSAFDTTLSNTPAYSPQLKADVEAAFGAMLRTLLSKLDSYIPPRPGRKFGETINLTMQELHVLRRSAKPPNWRSKIRPEKRRRLRTPAMTRGKAKSAKQPASRRRPLT
ncbi:MAG TPA: hypothetical protein VG734_20655 [Lacunisphaera sp.]|nr:hypothetical protein [Lacunisphaera sp.]